MMLVFKTSNAAFLAAAFGVAAPPAGSYQP
jgi:hypothetical protein